MAEAEKIGPKYVRGVWVAYHADFSDVVPFNDELRASRYALANFMQVLFCPFGRSPREVVREEIAAERAKRTAEQAASPVEGEVESRG